MYPVICMNYANGFQVGIFLADFPSGDSQCHENTFFLNLALAHFPALKLTFHATHKLHTDEAICIVQSNA